MEDKYVASYASAVLPVLDWVTSGDWMDTYLSHDADFYGELKNVFEMPVEEILAMLPHPLFARAARCSFDDLLTAEFEGSPSNVLDQYLGEVGSELEKADIEFLTAFRTSAVHVYHVEVRIPYESVVLRDLSGGARPIEIDDEQLTAALSAGDKIATRILTISDKDYLAGPILALGKDAFETFQHAFEETFKEQIRKLEKYLQKDPRQRSRVRQEILKGSAAVVSGIWVASTLATLDKAMPTAGEDEPEALFYASMPYALPVEPIISCLDVQPRLNRPLPREFLWLWYADEMGPASGLKAIVWITGPDLMIESWDSDVIEEAVKTISALLGDAVGEATIEEIGDDDEGTDDDAANLAPVPMSDEDEVEFRARVHHYLDYQFRGILDIRVTELQNQIPRELMKTIKGKKQLKKWLESVEARLKSSPDRVGFADYDLLWVWKELGMEGQRQAGLFE